MELFSRGRARKRERNVTVPARIELGNAQDVVLVISVTWYGGGSSFTVLRRYMVYTFDRLSPSREGRVYAMEERDSGRPKGTIYP